MQRCCVLEKKIHFAAITLLVLAIVIVVLAISSSFSSREVEVRVSTTTSLYQTGLLEYLADKFRESYPNVRLAFIAVGTGRALKLAEQGDVCAVFVHAPSLERQYLERGVIEAGRIFAYNYFVIVGPLGDPADVKNAKNVIDAFRRIYEAGEKGIAKFVSRGDSSGTHVRELSLWRSAGVDPHGRTWYKETGLGMSETLIVANEIEAYTLSDISTFLSLKKRGKIPTLEVLYGQDTELINIYSAYLVKRCSGVQREYAEKFVDFVTSDEGQSLVASYGVDEFGKPLFKPATRDLQRLRAIWEKFARG